MINMKEKLINWANQYETAEFVKDDPIQIPCRYSRTTDIEISAFVTAWLSWGNRKQIIKTADYIDKEIFRGEPYTFIMLSYWEKFKDDNRCLYRTFNYSDFYNLCARLHELYNEYLCMEDMVMEYDMPLVSTLRHYFRDINGIPSNDSKSACKRLNMFCRWMVRQDSPVDLGIWFEMSPSDLIIPLDTHVHRIALQEGITKRKTADMETAKEITDYFKDIFPDDPCRGDFALFGYGVNEKGEKDVSEI